VIRFLLLSILILLLARAFWRVMDAVIEAAGGTTGKSRSPVRSVKLQRDPVCGTFVSPPTAVSLTAGESTHYFCSERCRNEFVSRSGTLPHSHAS
jgi:YHS domain-containing protein